MQIAKSHLKFYYIAAELRSENFQQAIYIYIYIYIYYIYMYVCIYTCFNYQLNAQFLYSITIYMLHYNPRNFSTSTMLIFRRSNCIITTSNNVEVRSQLFTEGDVIRCCNNTI